MQASFYYDHNTSRYALSTTYPRQSINSGISLTYNLDDLKFYNKDHFKWSLTVLGNLTREVSNFQKLNIAKKYKRECIFH